MLTIAVVYYSGYGHTRVIAETFANTINAQLVEINQQGDIQDSEWEILNQADAIVFGTPTYMGAAPWQFKKFADSTSRIWVQSGWKDKIFAGFTNSAGLNGDKQVTLIQLQTLASQHGGIWVSLGLPPANKQDSTREDINSLCASVGLMTQFPVDVSHEHVFNGDLETTRLYAKRVAKITEKFCN